MIKSLRLLSLASFLAAGVATASLAAGDNGGVGSKSVTGTELNSQQQGTPSTGTSGTTATGTYGMNNQANQPGNSYPGVVGPTGSTQPDATNPVRSSPSGGGGGSGAGGGNSR
jgi:hypothetical protein